MTLPQCLYGTGVVSKNVLQHLLQDLDTNTRLSSAREFFHCFFNMARKCSALESYCHLSVFI